MKEIFMREAIQLSLETMRQGKGGPFGAVVVRDNQIIARGSNQVITSNDPTAHAEIVAIREAGRRLGAWWLEDCDLYTSCEPCPMCLGAGYWARIRKLYFAASRQDAASAGFIDERIYQEVARPHAQREIASEQLLREAAQAALAEWNAREGKIFY